MHLPKKLTKWDPYEAYIILQYYNKEVPFVLKSCVFGAIFLQDKTSSVYEGGNLRTLSRGGILKVFLAPFCAQGSNCAVEYVVAETER